MPEQNSTDNKEEFAVVEPAASQHKKIKEKLPTSMKNTPDQTANKIVAKYKKAPNAPKRFKPAFIFFSAEKHKEIRAQMGDKARNERSADISKRISKAWKLLRPEEKAKWQAMARDDMARYEFEKLLYTGPWRVLTRDKPKDAKSPKRPMSAFLAFANSRRAAVKREMPHVTNGDLSRSLAAMWKAAPEWVRKAYKEAERDQMQKYQVALKKWKEDDGDEGQEQNRLQEGTTIFSDDGSVAICSELDDPDEGLLDSLSCGRDDDAVSYTEVTCDGTSPSMNGNLVQSSEAPSCSSETLNGTQQTMNLFEPYQCFPSIRPVPWRGESGMDIVPSAEDAWFTNIDLVQCQALNSQTAPNMFQRAGGYDNAGIRKPMHCNSSSPRSSMLELLLEKGGIELIANQQRLYGSHFRMPTIHQEACNGRQIPASVAPNLHLLRSTASRHAPRNSGSRVTCSTHNHGVSAIYNFSGASDSNVPSAPQSSSFNLVRVVMNRTYRLQ